MDVFHYEEFWKLKYIHHTVVTFSRLQWSSALSSAKVDSIITRLLDRDNGCNGSTDTN